MFVASFGPTPDARGERREANRHLHAEVHHHQGAGTLDWARVSQPMLGTPRGIGVVAVGPPSQCRQALVDFWLSRMP